MNIKTATKIAIWSVIIGMIMSILYPSFNEWIIRNYYQASETRDTGRIFTSAYSIIRTVFEDGGILVFLIAVAQRQKGE